MPNPFRGSTGEPGFGTASACCCGSLNNWAAMQAREVSPLNELRREVYTAPAGDFTERRAHPQRSRVRPQHPLGDWPTARVGAALNRCDGCCEGAAADSVLGAAQRAAGGRRQRAAELAAASAAGGRPGIRRTVAQLAFRAPRRGPGGHTGAAGVRRGRRHRRVRRAAGGPAGGVAGPPGRSAHQLRAGPRESCGQVSR